MDLCACVSEFQTDGEGKVLQELSLLSYTVCDTRAKVWLWKKTMDLCACESVEYEHGVVTVSPVIQILTEKRLIDEGVVSLNSTEVLILHRG